MPQWQFSHLYEDTFDLREVLFCVGLSDIPGEAMVKLYCPKCMDVYTPKLSRHHHTDGAYFGTGFPHMLFMVHPEYRSKRPANQFVPRCVKLSLVSTTSIIFVAFWHFWNQKNVFIAGCMGLKFTLWLINSNFRLHQVSRAPWSQSAKSVSDFSDLFKAIVHALANSVNDCKSILLHVFWAIIISVHWLI